MSIYKPERGKFTLQWVSGFDIYGRPIKYQSLVEYEEPKKADSSAEPTCEHSWEFYKGFLVEEFTCIKCGTVKK